MSIVIGIGKWGGIYWYKGFSWRLCLGWISFSYLPMEDGDMIDAATNWMEQELKKLGK